MILLTDAELFDLSPRPDSREELQETGRVIAKAQAEKILDWLDSSSLRVIDTSLSVDSLFREHRQIPESAWQQLRKELENHDKE